MVVAVVVIESNTRVAVLVVASSVAPHGAGAADTFPINSPMNVSGTKITVVIRANPRRSAWPTMTKIIVMITSMKPPVAV